MSKLTYHLKVVNRYGRIFKNELLQPLGLMSREAEILLAVSRKPGRSQDSIADYLLIDKSGVARCLSNMEERGLVVRTVSPTDRRVTLVNLSPEAEALVEPIREINRKWSDFVTAELSAEEEELLHKALESVCARVLEAQGRRKKP